MSKELEALENIKHYDNRVGLHQDDYNVLEYALKRLENQDEVLRIIKESNIIKLERHKDTNRCYLIYTFDKVQIANDEFDLLKEVLL